MKKTIIILLIIMFISFIISGVLAGIQLQNMDNLKIRAVDVKEEKEIELSERLKEIVVKTSIVSNINILQSDGNKIKVTLEGNYRTVMDRRININLDNRVSTLKILAEQKGLLRYIQFGDYEDNLTLNIYIPEKYNKVLEIDAFYDNLNVDEKVSDNVKINGANKYRTLEEEIKREIGY